LARHGRPSNPFYLTGQVGGQPFSVHTEGEQVILTGVQGRQEIDLVPPTPNPVAASGPAETPGAAVRRGQPGPAEWPEPLCPAGVVDSRTVADDATARAPGTSPLDEVPWDSAASAGLVGDDASRTPSPSPSADEPPEQASARERREGGEA
jgi:hypothetical protein